MSRFLSKRTAAIAPYTPGEQPRDKRYIKLNTNECPYPPAPAVLRALEEIDNRDLRLYPDPENLALRQALAKHYGLSAEQVFAGGGSDEVLYYFFMAFFDRGDAVYYPDISYGFYPVYANMFDLRAVERPLREDFSVCVEDYCGVDGHIVLANPNAPTGIALTPAQIERMLQSNPDRLVLIDEAYVDFSDNKTCLPLLSRYDNLILVRTASKSRALAGMRLGWAMAEEELIAGMDRVRFSFDPYNLSRTAVAAGIASVEDGGYCEEICARVKKTRDRTAETLRDFGFTVLPSESNFLFAKSDAMEGGELYRNLKERGVLVRHFANPRIRDFVRITVGSDKEMDAFLAVLKEFLG